MTSLQEHLKGIAAKGNKAMRKKYSKKQRSEWAKKGGWPKGKSRKTPLDKA